MEANGSKVEKAAESAMLRLAARWMMVVGVPAIIAAGAWIGREVVESTRANTLATVRLEGKVDGVQGRIDSNVTLLNSRIDAQVDRLKGLEERDRQHDQRMDRQDGKIDIIHQRIWQLPARAQPEEQQQRQQWQNR